MSHYTTVLNEMLNLLPRHQFETLVNKHDNNRYVKRFNSWHQLVAMLYAQSSGKQSLRDIQRGLEANPARLYHLGLPGIKPSTLSDAKQHEIKAAKQFFNITPDSIYCMDKGYMDFTWFRRINDEGAFFVTRAKDNLKRGFIGQHSEANKKGVLSDNLIALEGFYSSQDYPYPLRLIRYYDAETDKELVFLCAYPP